MIILDNIVVTDEFLNARFCCNLALCKGECCVAGDAGAPLEDAEIGLIEDNLEAIKPYMRPEGIKVVEENDVYDYDDFGELVTPSSTAKNVLSCISTKTAPPCAPSKKPTWKARPTFGNRFRATSTPSA